MDIEAKNTVYQIPYFTRREAYNFGAKDKSLEIYQELNKIAEEIEECRLRNL